MQQQEEKTLCPLCHLRPIGPKHPNLCDRCDHDLDTEIPGW